MKKISTYVLFYVFTIFYSCGQDNEFEKELNRFRFSLNSELEKYEDKEICKFKFNKNDSIILLIDNFVLENENRIKTYRQNILEKYKNNPDFKFDIAKYEKVDVSDINKSLKDFDLGKNVPLSKLLWINPISETSMLRSVYFSQKKALSKLAIFNAKISITASLIKTKKINNYQWEIIENSYDIVSKFIYDLNKGKVTKIEIFERKVKNNH